MKKSPDFRGIPVCRKSIFVPKGAEPALVICCLCASRKRQRVFVPKGTKERHTKRIGRGTFFKKVPLSLSTVHRTIFLIHP